MPPHSSDTSASSKAQPRSLCVDTHRHPSTTPTSPSGVSPHPSPHGEWLIPVQFPLEQHVVPLGWELYTANMLMATSWSMRVLPMGGGLCCSSTWNSLSTSSATAGKVSILQTEREAGESRLCPGVWAWLSPCHISWPRGNPWGAASQPGAVGNEGAGCFFREGSEGLLCDRQAAFFWQENTAFMSHF